MLLTNASASTVISLYRVFPRGAPTARVSLSSMDKGREDYLTHFSDRVSYLNQFYDRVGNVTRFSDRGGVLKSTCQN